MNTYGKPSYAHIRLRWSKNNENPDTYKCSQELIIPLRENDRRYEKNEPFTATLMSEITRESANPPCIDEDGNLYFDVPVAFGVEAFNDARMLDAIPVLCVALDGTIIDRNSNILRF